MSEARTIEKKLEQIFNRIQNEEMQGIPILNPRIKVQALGFHAYQGRMLGVVITPWMMNLLLLPGPDDDWQDLRTGHKEVHEFPAKPYQFMANEFSGLGKCQSHSLFSPMQGFTGQAQAVAAAKQFLTQLLVPTQPQDEAIVDEKMLGRILQEKKIALNESPLTERPVLSRRDVLRGKFNNNTECSG